MGSILWTVENHESIRSSVSRLRVLAKLTCSAVQDAVSGETVAIKQVVGAFEGPWFWGTRGDQDQLVLEHQLSIANHCQMYVHGLLQMKNCGTEALRR